MTRAASIRCAFNRLVLFVLALGGLAASGICFFAPNVAITTLVSQLNAVSLAPVAPIETGAAIVAVICAVVLVIEIVGDGGSKVFEAVIDGGAVEYPADVITFALESDLKDIVGIEDARVRLDGDRRKAHVYALLAVNPADDGQSFATRASSAIHERLEGLGLEAGYVRLTFRPIRGRGLTRDPRVAKVA